jgi:hypothetical protein
MSRKRQGAVSVETLRKRNNARKSDSRSNIELKQNEQAKDTIAHHWRKLRNYKAEVYPYESFASYHKPLVIRLKKVVFREE